MLQFYQLTICRNQDRHILKPHLLSLQSDSERVRMMNLR